jgi:hypothetical protein
MKRRLLLSLCLGLGASTLAAPVAGQTLEGFARLPADTFAPGPTSGQLIAPTNGRVPPFVDKQPVQGISSVLRTDGYAYRTRVPVELSMSRHHVFTLATRRNPRRSLR